MQEEMIEEEIEMESSSRRASIVVGYALTTKKIKSFLQPKLEGLARYYYYY